MIDEDAPAPPAHLPLAEAAQREMGLTVALVTLMRALIAAKSIDREVLTRSLEQAGESAAKFGQPEAKNAIDGLLDMLRP